MQENPNDPKKKGSWDRDETTRFLDSLITAQRSNKAKEVWVGVFKRRPLPQVSDGILALAKAKKDVLLRRNRSFLRSARAHAKRMYLDAIFPPKARIEFRATVKEVAGQLLASRTSTGSSATVGGCIRTKIVYFQNMSPQAKRDMEENMHFASDLAMLTLGTALLMLLLGDALKIYEQFHTAYPLLEFQREFNSYYGPDPAKYPLGMYPY